MKTKKKRIVYELIVDVPEAYTLDAVTDRIIDGIKAETFDIPDTINVQKLNAVYEGKPREVILCLH
jgi:hypothetical protein